MRCARVLLVMERACGGSVLLVMERACARSSIALSTRTHARGRPGRAAQAGGPEKAERTPYWEPMVEVCRYLGISKSGLSKYSKELAGGHPVPRPTHATDENGPLREITQKLCYLQGGLQERGILMHEVGHKVTSW